MVGEAKAGPGAGEAGNGDRQAQQADPAMLAMLPEAVKLRILQHLATAAAAPDGTAPAPHSLRASPAAPAAGGRDRAVHGPSEDLQPPQPTSEGGHGTAAQAAVAVPPLRSGLAVIDGFLSREDVQVSGWPAWGGPSRHP